MAQRKRRRTKQKQDYPGWMWMLFGLAIGLSVAFAIYMKDERANAAARKATATPASMASPIVQQQVSPPEAEQSSEPRFSFYDMLPNFEVVIPEQERDVRRDRQVQAVESPGTYVLQAGSFTAVSDADRRRAELALLGVESRVQQVTIDDRTYHRVRIGPMNDLDKLNRIRNQLRQANIDVLRIRLGD